MIPSGKLVVAWSLAIAGCADIDTHGLEACGNNVVEPDVGEDCDLIVDPAIGDDLQCGPPDGSPGQCRYVCDGAECPRGWTCADDGICRAPSGTFEVDDEPAVLVAAEQIALRDILGGPEAELVARLEGDVFVFATDDEGFAARHELSIPNARGDLGFADIDGDGLSDLLAPAASVALDAGADPRVHVLRADGERLVTAIVPQTLAPDPVAAVAAVAVGDGAAEVLLQVVRRSGAGLTARVDASNCMASPPGSLLELATGSDATVLVPVAARLWAGDLAHVAIPILGSPSVDIVRVERSCGAGVCQPTHPIAEPCATRLTLTQRLDMPAAVADPGCLFFDVDAAGGSDLVCHLASGAFGVAIDDGVALALRDDGDDMFGGLDDLPEAQGRACASVRRILAAGDLDADGDTDLVTPHGVFVADAVGSWRRAYARTLGDGWGEAVTGDFDRDGRREIVASVLQADAECVPVRLQSLVETAGAYGTEVVRDAALAERLRSGDFDGDGIDDLAVVQPGPQDVRVAVFFGDTSEALDDKVSVGGFAQVGALASVRSREGTEINEDLVGDLAIVSEQGEFTTLVTGTTTRSLLSPLLLDATPASHGRLPTIVLAGSLVARPTASEDAEPASPDVLTIRGPKAWLVRDDDVHHGDDPFALPLHAFTMRTACSAWAVASPRPVGGSLLAGIDGHDTRISDAPHGCDLEVPPTLVVAAFGGTRDAPQIRTTTVVVAEPARRPTTIDVFDFDASGQDDVLVHFSHENGLRRGSLGWIRDPQPGAAGVVPVLEPLAAAHDVLAATPIDADADDAIELAIVATDGLRIVDYAPDREPAIEVSAPVFPLPRLPDGDDPVLLKSGDIDGNELLDLALHIAGAVWVYPAIERD